jgi:hypothetical protein
MAFSPFGMAAATIDLRKRDDIKKDGAVHPAVQA